MTDEGAKALCAVICVQSVKDYFKLREDMDLEKPYQCRMVSRGGELGRFFRSQWAKDLFGTFGIRVDVALKELDKIYEDGSYKERLTRLGYSLKEGGAS